MTLRTKPTGWERRTYRARSLRYHMALATALRNRRWRAGFRREVARTKRFQPFAKRRKA